jgi:flagellar assembly factor FliW
MPQTPTASFGLLEYAEDAVVEFPGGLPAFEDQRRFVLIERPDLAPLVFLQSLDRHDLALPAVPMAMVAPDYPLELSDEDRALLGLAGDAPVEKAGLLCLAVVTFKRDEPPTVNLMAPVVVNLALRRAVQAIQTAAGYSHAHPLFRPEEEQNPCS